MNTYDEYALRGGKPYVVSCLLNIEQDNETRVLATRQTFSLYEAEKYAATVAKCRIPEVKMVCIFCGKGWRFDSSLQHCGEPIDWPRCEICHAC